MADNKNLRISAKIDEKGLKAFDASLKAIDKKLTGLGKKLTVLNENFKKLSKSIRADVIKSFEKADKNIDHNTKTMDKAVNTTQKLTKTYQNLQRAITGGVNGAMNGAQLMPAPGGGFTFIPGGGGGGSFGPGGGGRGPRQPRRPGDGRMLFGGAFSQGQAQRFMSGAYQVADQVGGIAGLIQNQKTQQFVNMANIHSFGAGLYNEAKGGGIGSLYAYLMMNKKGINSADQAGGTGAANVQIGAGAVGTVLKGGLSGNAGVGTASAANGLASAAVAQANNTPMSIEANSLKTLNQASKGIYATDISKIQQLQSIAPGLLNANRRLAGGGMRAAWMGVGAGMDAGSSFNFFTQGANQFGANVMMGGGLGRSALALQRKGFDLNAMTSGMGNIQGLLTGTNTQRVEQANTMVVDAISRGVALGIKDPQTLEALSNSIASANSTVNGAMTDSGALAGALAAGLSGKTANPALISQRFQGLGVLSQGINSNPVLRNRAYAAATSILGNDAPMVARTSLVQASLGELMGGSARLTALLPGNADRQMEARRREVSAKLQDMVSLAGNDLPGVRNALAKNGHNGLALLSDPKMRMAIAADLKTAHGFTDTILSDRGFGAALNFVNGNLSKGDKKLLGSLKDQGGVALSAEQSRAKALLEPLGELFKNKDMMHTAVQAFSGLGEFMKTIGSLQTGTWDNAERVAGAIEHLVETLNGGSVEKVNKVTKKVESIESASGKVGKEARHSATFPGARKG